MFPLLYKYLILNEYVTIPGVGYFAIERQASKIDTEEKIIHSPVTTIRYKEEKDVADKAFYTFLADEMNIDVVEAIRQFQDFAFRLKNNIASKKVVNLPSFGTLKMVKDGIKFTPTNFDTTYFPPVSLEEALRLHGSNDVTGEIYVEEQRKSYWWVYALLFALIGVGAIVYHYYYDQV